MMADDHRCGGVPRLGRLAFEVLEIDVPALSQSTITTRMLTIWADAGLVPWAEDGIRQMSRWPSPRLS
jgi:hypothetical protein